MISCVILYCVQFNESCHHKCTRQAVLWATLGCASFGWSLTILKNRMLGFLICTHLQRSTSHLSLCLHASFDIAVCIVIALPEPCINLITWQTLQTCLLLLNSTTCCFLLPLSTRQAYPSTGVSAEEQNAGYRDAGALSGGSQGPRSLLSAPDREVLFELNISHYSCQAMTWWAF
jgi:hypothetical protein